MPLNKTRTFSFLQGGVPREAGGGGLLSHFKELTVLPKNAEELKGLILQLAIQGKLTKNWRESRKLSGQDVEPASVLLERIKAEKEQLIKAKKIKKEKALAEVEYENDIPRNWVPTRLGEIGDWGAGATPLRSRPEFYGGEINWFKSGELNNGIMDYDSKEKINELALKGSSLRLNKVGDVLIAMYGATIGKTGILAVEGTTNQAVCACTPFTGIYNRYLHLLLRSLNETFTKQGEGGAQPNISRVKIRNQAFLLPPLEEQKAIVSIVNQLFAEVEQLEAATKERVRLKEDYVASSLRQLTEGDTALEWAALQPHFKTFFTETQNIKTLRESILQLAVQGKLTRKWRTSHPLGGDAEGRGGIEPANKLLARIKAEKAQLIADKKIKKEKPLPAITEDEIPYDLPEGWEWCRLSELTELITKGSSPKWQGIQYVDEGQGVLFVTSENVGSYDLIWNKKKYVESRFNEIEPRSVLKRNDILMNIVGGSIGRTALYNIDDLANINQAVTIIRLFPKVSFEYFLHFFNSPTCISYMYDKQVDNARPNLSMGNISKFMIPFPSYEEQKAIVQKVNALLALCDQLENEIETRTTSLEDWMKSCLRGEGI